MINVRKYKIFIRTAADFTYHNVIIIFRNSIFYIYYCLQFSKYTDHFKKISWILNFFLFFFSYKFYPVPRLYSSTYTYLYIIKAYVWSIRPKFFYYIFVLHNDFIDIILLKLLFNIKIKISRPRRDRESRCNNLVSSRIIFAWSRLGLVSKTRRDRDQSRGLVHH